MGQLGKEQHPPPIVIWSISVYLVIISTGTVEHARCRLRQSHIGVNFGVQAGL